MNNIKDLKLKILYYLQNNEFSGVVYIGESGELNFLNESGELKSFYPKKHIFGKFYLIKAYNRILKEITGHEYNIF